MLKSNTLLLREQIELCGIEKRLLAALPLIQEALNSLKVEELHLKSQSVQQTLSAQTVSSSLATDIIDETPTKSIVTHHEQINQQEIDLNITCTLNLYDVETDSD